VGHNYYPAFLDLRDRQCIVVGGGKVAERKVAVLLASGAKVILISPCATDRLAKLSGSKRIKHIKRDYRKGDLESAFLVIAATSDPLVNERISRDAPGLLNAVDAPELANFIVPSVIKRGPLALAVSTAGASPALAKSIKEELELLYGREFGLFVEFLGKQRKKIMREITRTGTRKRLLRQIASPQIVEILRKKGIEKAKDVVLKIIKGTLE
jgi:precorrin-2 dehydrogenase/sirohydrochlorin ferrochelatase